MPGLAMNLAGRCVSLMIVWYLKLLYTLGGWTFGLGGAWGGFRFCDGMIRGLGGWEKAEGVSEGI